MRKVYFVGSKKGGLFNKSWWEIAIELVWCLLFLPAVKEAWAQAYVQFSMYQGEWDVVQFDKRLSAKIAKSLDRFPKCQIITYLSIFLEK